MKLRVSRAASALSVAAILSVGCAGLVKPRSVAPADEVTVLKERLLELQRQVTVHEVEIARLKSLMTGSASWPPPAHLAPLSQPAYQAPAEEPVVLPPPGSATLEIEDLSAADPHAATKSPAAIGRALPEDQQALYDLGLDFVRGRRFADAETAFRRLLERYPKTDLSDNASYWLGESLYSRGEYEQAFEVFRQTVERYPEGNKLPDALLKVGLCLEKTGDRIGARDVLEEVIRRFPATAASATATAALAGLH